MNRRTLIVSLGSLTATGLAGCLKSNPGAEEPLSSPTENESTMTDQSLVVKDRSCGTEKQTASISYDTDESSVTVDGVMAVADACKTATLESADIDAQNEELRVVVAETDTDSDGPCADCITEVTYHAEFTFDGELPSRAIVNHRSLNQTQSVATASK